jgi:hypothetical protein
MMRRGAAEMNLMIVWTIFAMMTLVALCWPQARRQRNLRRIGLLTKKPGLAG